MRQAISTRLNLEMAVTDEMKAIALDLRPEDVCLVPEKRQEITTEGGLEVYEQYDKVAPFISQLEQAGIRVSLFIDPDEKQIDASRRLGVSAIELHTGAFADAKDESERERQLERIIIAVSIGEAAGLRVNAGHGLNYKNVEPIARIEGIQELNIGHAIIAEAVFEGLGPAVRRMRELINNPGEK